MGIQVVTAAYGRPALVELHGLISALKSDDPLSPVSVLVPSNYVGVSTRRMLASGELGPIAGHSGLAGIDLLTTFRLAGLLGAPSLTAQDRKPVSTPMIAAAVRGVLATTKTMFSEVREHPSTERALVRVHRELRNLTPEQLDLLAAQSSRSSAVVALHRDVAARLASDWYDEVHLLEAAISEVRDKPHLVRERGHVVLYLPQTITAAEARLIQAMAVVTPVTVLAGYTGAEDADVLINDMISRLGLVPPEVSTPIPHGTDVITVSDADEETRAVLRDVTAAVLDGVALDSMAILYGSDQPYARLLTEHLVAAGIPRNGSAMRRIDESVIGRMVLSLLALPDHNFRRTDVLAVLASAPIRVVAGQPDLTPVNEWERISRDAGVVGGADEWQTRLDRYLTEQHDAVDRLKDDDDPRLRRALRAINEATRLRDFVQELTKLLDPAAVPASWTLKARWLQTLVTRYVGPVGERDDWPEIELTATQKLDDAVERLTRLDEIEHEPSLSTFRRTLEVEFTGGVGTSGNFGEGIFVGRIDQALGVDLERVFILGMAEGLMPGGHHEDSLLPDSARSALGGSLRLASSRIAEDHRSYLAALAASSGPQRLYFPRGDLRRSAERIPSRWLLDTIEILNGERVWSDGLEAVARAGHPWFVEVPSFTGGLRRVAFPSSDQEYELRSLLDHHEAGGSTEDHHLVETDPRFGRSTELAAARASSSFTRFDGNLTHVVTEDGVRLDVVSPTRLENWAKCPHRYLMQDVLRVHALEQPEAILRISALHRGTLVHRAMDEFLSEVMESDAEVPGANEPWSRELELALLRRAEHICDEFEARGLAGKRIFWKRDRQEILDDLVRTLRADSTRSRRGTLLDSEFGFGLSDADEPAVPHTLTNGRTIMFRGSADRVELSSSGQLIVIDYKTGGTSSFTGIDKEDKDPTKLGTKLQLPVYALAARHVYGHHDDPVHAAYWFVSTKGAFKWIGYDVDDRVMERFDEVLVTVIGGISAGVFPAKPATAGYQSYVECQYCDPDGLGTATLQREWERMRDDAALVAYRQLAEPDEVPSA